MDTQSVPSAHDTTTRSIEQQRPVRRKRAAGSVPRLLASAGFLFCALLGPLLVIVAGYVRNYSPPSLAPSRDYFIVLTETGPDIIMLGRTRLFVGEFMLGRKQAGNRVIAVMGK